jgi:hypothetical protein
VQKVRHVRGGEYMSGELQMFHGESGIQQQPADVYSPEANGLANRHILTFHDLTFPIICAMPPQHQVHMLTGRDISASWFRQ